MFHRSKNDKMSYGIVGIGRFGSALATELAAAGADIVVIDSDEDKVREMRELTDNAYVVANLEKKTLTETGIQNCDVAVVCIGERMDTSILTTLHLVSLGIPKVIAKASSAEHGVILEKLGAEVVYPERDMAQRTAVRYSTNGALEYVELTEDYAIFEMPMPDAWVGKTPRELELRRKFRISIIGLMEEKQVVPFSDPDYVFRTGERILAAGSRSDMTKRMRLFR